MSERADKAPETADVSRPAEAKAVSGPPENKAVKPARKCPTCNSTLVAYAGEQEHKKGTLECHTCQRRFPGE